ncbi:class I SAM-dependent methyltransferase [Actinomycetospora endophytica]|uniref:Class I SAM-dependent methyltransferase n=1 Tax=Actinomycetospora endophytica TaxID=2291215 RepID=A0ABS8PG62_9PSEU|nr:class I SAM-dependent methyltransferase [Actinomycetospora endophytica]MCD2197260.1 class I SAM-dependent methyltransferase [Actinomycetospora endophytica]
MLEGVAETMLVTVYLRAVDARSSTPILGDPYAVGLVDRLASDGHSFTKYALGRGNAPVIAARGRRLDAWTRGFLDAHPDGQVLHLGCGLDSRPLRVHRPAGSRWVDVDQAEVIALRRELYDLPPEIVTIPASVTDPGWWDEVEPALPTILVAEGLLMYLPDVEVHALVDRARERLTAGVELAFDGFAPWVITLTRWSRYLQSSGIRLASPLEDLTAGRPGARTLADLSVVGELAHGSAPGPLLRAVFGGLDVVPFMDDAFRLVHLELAA